MNNIPRLHSLVDAFAKLNGMLDPQSDAYKLRNPLLLKAFHPKHDRNENGLRRFKSFTSGYDNALLDAQIKCSGKSFSRLKTDSTIRDLVCVYGQPASSARNIVNFLKHALYNDNITEQTSLGWFLEDIDKKETING